MTENELIERAIQSAEARIYKLQQSEKRNHTARHFEKAENQIELQRVTVEALKKQIAKKPTEIDEREETDFYYLAFMCPTCEVAVIGQPYRPNYCKHCGQKLDWCEEGENSNFEIPNKSEKATGSNEPDWKEAVMNTFCGGKVRE